MSCHEIATIYFGVEITIMSYAFFFQPEASLLQRSIIYNYNLNLGQNFGYLENIYFH